MPLDFKYSTSLPNEPIVVANETVTIPLGGGAAEGVGKVSVQLLPDPSWAVEAEFSSFVPLSVGTTVAVTFPGRKMTFDASVLGSPTKLVQGHPRTTLLLQPPNPLFLGDPTNIADVRFGLLNFPDVRAGSFLVDSPAGGRTRCDRLELTADEWLISVESLPDIGKRIDSLEASGGYAITHVGSIKKRAGEFKAEEAKALLYVLHEFLSFACGRWTTPILAIGFNQAGESVWEEWGMRLVSPWKPVLSWFDWHHGLELCSLFPGFVNRWNDPAWRSTISTAIYWYLRSNLGAGPDGGITLAQAALERLAWMLLVEHKRCLSGDGFRRLPDSDWLRLLLADVGVPLTLPTTLTEMTKVAKGLGWKDGPDAIAGARNSLVHANSKAKDLPFVEAWRLMQFYLELVLLRLFNYCGPFGNRAGLLPRMVGQVESVPWAQ